MCAHAAQQECRLFRNPLGLHLNWDMQNVTSPWAGLPMTALDSLPVIKDALIKLYRLSHGLRWLEFHAGRHPSLGRGANHGTGRLPAAAHRALWRAESGGPLRGADRSHGGILWYHVQPGWCQSPGCCGRQVQAELRAFMRALEHACMSAMCQPSWLSSVSGMHGCKLVHHGFLQLPMHSLDVKDEGVVDCLAGLRCPRPEQYAVFRVMSCSHSRRPVASGSRDGWLMLRHHSCSVPDAGRSLRSYHGHCLHHLCLCACSV